MAQEPRVDHPADSPATRVQILTPLASGAIAVVQVAGTRALSISEAVFRPRNGKPLAELPAGRVAYGDFLDEAGAVFDDGLAVHGVARGQPWVQFNVHGGVRIVQRLVRRLVDLGAGVAAGEQQTGRGGDKETRSHDRSTPANSAGVALGLGIAAAAEDLSFDWLCPVDRWVQQCLAEAATPRVVEWLIRQGDLWHKLLADWRRRIEAGDADTIRRDAQVLLEQGDECHIWRGRTLAILGLPNAGKSTIANRLAGRGVSLVADAPGTTRDWVGEPIALQGWPVFLVDTAGLRPTDDPVEADGVVRALQQARQADARLLVVDSTCPPSGSEDWLVRQVGLQSVDTIAYMKCDLPPGRRLDVGLPAVAGARVVRVSGLTGAGWPELERVLLEGFGFPASQESGPLVFCSQVRSCVTRLAAAPGARELMEAYAGLRVVELCPTHKTMR